MDEREDERRLLQQVQSLPLTKDGALDIKGFHLRDADHRRLACELISELVSTLLPSPEAVVRARYFAEEDFKQQQQQQLLLLTPTSKGSTVSSQSNSTTISPLLAAKKVTSSVSTAITTGSAFPSASGDSAFATTTDTDQHQQQKTLSRTGSLVLSTSTSSVEQAREQIRTRTRTIKLTNSNSTTDNKNNTDNDGISKSSLTETFDQIRPFLSQLLLYPDCCAALLTKLSDLFVTFVQSAATLTDCEAIVQTFVKWVSTLILRFSPDLCLDACEFGVIEIKRRASTMKKMSLVVDPEVIANTIVSDVIRHLEDEAEYYPAARISLVRLTLTLKDEFMIDAVVSSGTNKSADDDDDDSDDEDNNSDSSSSSSSESDDDCERTALNDETKISSSAHAPDDRQERESLTTTSPFASSSPDDSQAVDDQSYYYLYYYFAQSVFDFAKCDPCLTVRRGTLCELTRWLNQSLKEVRKLKNVTPKRKVSSSIRNCFIQRASMCFDVVKSLEKESRPNDPDDDDDDDVDNSNDDVEASQQQQDSERPFIKCFWNFSDSLRYSCIPLLLAIGKVLVEQISDGQNSPSNSSCSNSTTGSDRLLKLLHQVIKFFVSKFVLDASWRVRHQVASHLAPFTRVCRQVSNYCFAKRSTANDEMEEGKKSSLEFAQLLRNACQIATVFSTDAEPTVRAAVAKDSDKILLDSYTKTLALSSPSTPTLGTSFSSTSATIPSLKILPIMLTLSLDSATCVRQAIIRPFFRTWNKILLVNHGNDKKKNDKFDDHDEIRKEKETTKQQELPSSSASASPPASPAMIEHQLRFEEVLSFDGFRALLHEEQDESVQVAALQSIPLLGSYLLKENAEVLSECVKAVCRVVSAPTAVAVAPSSSSASSSSFFSSIAVNTGKLHIRRLAVQQLPLLTQYLSFDDFSAQIWSFLDRLLHDPAVAVRDDVITNCLPKIAEHYGATCALNMAMQWFVPLCEHKSFSQRRTGFRALCAVLEVLPELRRNGSDSFITSSSSATIKHLVEIAKEMYEKISKDKVELVREAVASCLLGTGKKEDGESVMKKIVGGAAKK